MSKRPNTIPSIQLNVALPLDIHTRLSAHLFSELEGRVPHGAYSRFLVELLRQHFAAEFLDLAAYRDAPAGVFVVSGTPETVKQLKEILNGN